MFIPVHWPVVSVFIIEMYIHKRECIMYILHKRECIMYILRSSHIVLFKNVAVLISTYCKE